MDAIRVEDRARELYESEDRGRGVALVAWHLRPEIVKDAWRSVARRLLKAQETG